MDKVHVFRDVGWCAVCWRCRITVAGGVSWEVAMALAWGHVADHRADPDRLWRNPGRLDVTRGTL